jgi:hypothetical protein
MRRAGILIVGLLGGCFTKALWSGSSKPPPDPRPSGEAACALDLATPVAGRSLSFAVGRPEPRAPKRMGIEMGRGRTRLHLRRPFALAFAGGDLIDGRTPLSPESITVTFAQTRTSDGTRRAPALLRIEGSVPPDFASRVERCEEPAEPRTLDEVEDPRLRVQLGRGVDTLVGQFARAAPNEVIAWRGVEGPGDWRDALDEAHRSGSLAPLAPYRVIVRLWRGGAATCYRLRLDDIVLLSGIRFTGERFAWEGLFIASLELPDDAPAAAAILPSRLVYREYKQDPKSASAVIWRVLATPVAVAADLAVDGAIDAAADWLAEHDEAASITRPRKK